MNTDLSQPVECPKCRVMMERSRAADADVDRCPSCHGLWLDLFEKEELTSHPEVARKLDNEQGDAPEHRGPLLCPRDRSTLITRRAFENRKVDIESCTVCGGVFLDAGELRRLHEVEPFGGDEHERDWRDRLMDVVGFFAS